MHTGNLQPCTDVVGSVCKCTRETFVLQQLEQKHTATCKLKWIINIIDSSISPATCKSEAIAHNRNMISEKKVLSKMSKCQMFVYSGHALSYTKLVHRHAT